MHTYTYVTIVTTVISWTISCLWSNITVVTEVYLQFVRRQSLSLQNVTGETRNMQPRETYLYREKKKPKYKAGSCECLKRQFTTVTFSILYNLVD